MIVKGRKIEEENTMKRENEGDMGVPPHKRSRRGDEEVRLLIPSKVCNYIFVDFIYSLK